MLRHKNITLGNNTKRQAQGHKSWQRGLRSEWVCKVILRCKGWHIIASRYRTPVGEIDIIARRGDTIAFVEVKARPNLLEASEAISWHQRQRLARAAAFFATKRPELSNLTMRFDAMLLTPYRWPKHIPNAWMLEEET